jgi:hypothetical protein
MLTTADSMIYTMALDVQGVVANCGWKMVAKS